MALVWTVAASAAIHAATLGQFRAGGRGASGLWTSEGTAVVWGSKTPGAIGPELGELSEAAEGSDSQATEAVIPIEVSEPDGEQGARSRLPTSSDPRSDGPEGGFGSEAPFEAARGARAAGAANPRTREASAIRGRGKRGRALPPNVVSAGAVAAGRDGPGGVGAGDLGDSPGNRTGGDDALGVGATGVRGMTLPLLRVLPLALSADPSWSTLPVGQVGSFDLAIGVTDGGGVHLASPIQAGGGAAAPQVRALVDQMLRLLGWPRFAVRASEMVEGVDKVRMTISIVQDAASAEILAASGGAYGLGADAPDGRRPGRAHCTWANGRRVNVTLVGARDL